MNQLWNQLRRQLLADKKKACLMAGLVAVMLLMWGRLILKQIPRVATASTPVAASAAPATPAAPASARAEPTGWRAAPAIYTDLPQQVSRDLFAFDPSGYQPTATSRLQQSEPAAQKSGSDSDDVTAWETRIKDKLQALHLQSTMSGAQPRAVINGQVLGVGQSIEGLTLREVRTREVVLEMDGRLVKLGM